MGKSGRYMTRTVTRDSVLRRARRTLTARFFKTSTTSLEIFLALRTFLAVGVADERAAGVTTKIKVPRQEFCESCKGTGAKAGTGVTTCQSCGGRGQLAYQQGFFTITRTCPACQGAGQIVRERCPECRGQGRVEKEKTIDLRIPPGVDTGTRLRVPGEGEVGVNGGAPGDLYVVLEVKEHPFFERRNSDLYCTIPVSVVQAALGTELQVPGLNGEEKLKIGEGTQSGAVFRIKGKGLPLIRNTAPLCVPSPILSFSSPFSPGTCNSVPSAACTTLTGIVQYKSELRRSKNGCSFTSR